MLVTHHLEDIIPEIDRVILLRQGRVHAEGPKGQILTAPNLASLFGTELDVFQRDGFYHAW
ncbi:MAG: hypothetical protein JO108_14655 [Acidobacteriaceae bacterium]|nr:hypothetical protein [Acidobacteriaceae bacterium]